MVIVQNFQLQTSLPLCQGVGKHKRRSAQTAHAKAQAGRQTHTYAPRSGYSGIPCLRGKYLDDRNLQEIYTAWEGRGKGRHLNRLRFWTVSINHKYYRMHKCAYLDTHTYMCTHIRAHKQNTKPRGSLLEALSGNHLRTPW